MKRFYKMVSFGKESEEWPLLLDGKKAKTPSGKILVCQSRQLAEAIVGEWNAQEEIIEPDNMPITQIQTTKLDFVDDRKEEAIEQLLAYVNTDLLLYHAPHPVELQEKQKEVWGKWLAWMNKEYMVHYETTTGLDVIEQSRSIHDAIESYIRKLNKAELVVFYILTHLCKSLILPIAFLEAEAEPDELFEAVQVEEIYKQKLHGQIDPETKEFHEKLQHECMAARTYLDLLS